MKSENKKTLKEEFFTRRMFYRFLFPSLISSVGLSFGNIVDALVVGTKLGTLGLAAIALIAPIFMVYNVIDLGIAVGGSVQFTRFLGEGKSREGVINFNQMLEAALAISFLFSLFGSLLLPQIMKVLGTDPSDGALYLTAFSYARILILAAPLFFINFLLYYYVRSDDNQKLASIGFVVGNIADIFLNIFFVINLNMGVEGAILATVIGKGISICIYIPHFFFKWTILCFSWVKPDIKKIWCSFKTGFASSSQYLFQFVLLLVLNHLLIIIGGENGLAVFDVVTNVSYVLLAVYEGMGATLQPLVGNYYGEKNRKAEPPRQAVALRLSPSRH
jgi:Na+-driven multidrug efflux pump